MVSFSLGSPLLDSAKNSAQASSHSRRRRILSQWAGANNEFRLLFYAVATHLVQPHRSNQIWTVIPINDLSFAMALTGGSTVMTSPPTQSNAAHFTYVHVPFSDPSSADTSCNYTQHPLALFLHR